AYRLMRLVAAIPIGVAALPRPRRLAQTLAEMRLPTLASRRALGNSRSITGLKKRARMRLRPAFSITCPTPDQRHTAPAMENVRVTPACAPSNTAWDKAPPVPLQKENNTAIRIIPVQIYAMTMT